MQLETAETNRHELAVHRAKAAKLCQLRFRKRDACKEKDEARRFVQFCRESMSKRSRGGEAYQHHLPLGSSARMNPFGRARVLLLI